MARTLLLVDDLRTNRKILRQMLCREYEILEAESGEKALEALARDSASISAVLLDISMPGMDGYEVLRRIRSTAEMASMPVIMITGSDDKETRIKSLSLGANDFVQKPYSFEIIAHCLQNNIALREAAITVSILEKDRLTGLWNREAFFQRAARIVEKEPAGAYILGCMDIDGFKIINDQYGSDMGDRVLKCIADALTESCNARGGICGRVFADQFISLYPRDLLHGDEVGPEAIEARVHEQTGISLTLSVGRYAIEDKNLGVNAMFDRASIAKSTVKGRFDAHVAVYRESMRDQILREQLIVNQMNGALAGGQFEVWYQPQYNRATNAMIGAEALVRWRHPRNGLIPPNDFIPIFERNGFIYKLDQFVWEKVCAGLRRWLDEGRAPLPVSVNISRYDAVQPDLIRVIASLVDKYALPRDLLRLEITESAFSASSQPIISAVRALVGAGFTVEIDDFGSGYSSLNTLKDVPVQILKLDMRFLENSGDSRRGGSIVESVVRMAKWLGISVIAEGVETLQQADYLLSIGCGYMQGYLFARPMTTLDYEAHCRNEGKEEHLLALETVENLDSNEFWDPKSMDTLIFNSYVGAACIFEYFHGQIEVTRSTRRFAEMIGGAAISVEDTLKMDWTACLDADSRRAMDEALARSKAENTDVTVELLLLRLPGCPERTYIRSTMRVIATAGDRRLVYNLIENITARREAEREIKGVAAELQNMMRDMPGGFIRLQREKSGALVPVYINDGMLTLTGMSRRELAAMYQTGACAGVHPDDITIFKGAIQQMLADDGEAHSVRYRLAHGEGGYIWLSMFGRFTRDASGGAYLNLYHSDSTKQVKDEQAQRALLDNLPCGAGVYEFSGGRMSLTYQNKSYWDLVGLHQEAYPDAAPMSAVHPDDIPVIMRDLSLAIAEKRDVACDIRLRHLTEGYRAVRLVGRIMHNEDGGFSIYATFTPADSGANNP